MTIKEAKQILQTTKFGVIEGNKEQFKEALRLIISKCPDDEEPKKKGK